jgi:hypothetical protein
MNQQPYHLLSSDKNWYFEIEAKTYDIPQVLKLKGRVTARTNRSENESHHILNQVPQNSLLKILQRKVFQKEK